MKNRASNILGFLVMCAMGGCSALEAANHTRLNSLLIPIPSTPAPTYNLTTLIPDGVVANAFKYTSCTALSTITSNTPTANSGGVNESEFLASDYNRISSIDSVYDIHECAWTGSLFNAQMVEFSWTVSPATAAHYSSFTVNWTGLLGQYVGACNGTSAPVSLFTVVPMEVFNGSTWNAFGVTPDVTLQTVSQLFSNPSNYLLSGKIWVRLYTGASPGSCATIHTDSISLTLTP